jgi:hypothetical protein
MTAWWAKNNWAKLLLNLRLKALKRGSKVALSRTTFFGVAEFGIVAFRLLVEPRSRFKGNTMKKFIPMVALLICFSSELIAEGKSYLDNSIKIIDTADIHREAQAWGICAAAYDLMAEILQESAPARAKLLSDLANGAELAVIISMVTREIDDEMTPEQFDNVWNFSKISGGEIPKTMLNVLLADLEADNSEGKNTFLADLGETVAVCASNLEGQQTYIDMWRDLAKSGLFQIQNE